MAAPLAIPPPPGLPLRVPARRRQAAVEDVGRACDAWELYTGCQHLTDALRGAGLRCAAGSDIKIEKRQDLLRPGEGRDLSPCADRWLVVCLFGGTLQELLAAPPWEARHAHGSVGVG